MFDGSAIRDLEGSLSGSINGMDITSDGAYFVTGEWVDETRKEETRKSKARVSVKKEKNKRKVS